MTTFKIPGLGSFSDDDDEPPNKKILPTHKHFLTINLTNYALKVVEGLYKTPDEKLVYNECNALYVFSEEEYNQLGVELPDDDPNEENDDCIYCEDCDRLYVGCCRRHPLYLVQDRCREGLPIPDGEPARAKKTIPVFFAIKPSKIPKAGDGIFANISIPKGFVFGPYEGVLLDNAEKATVDGYCWEVKSKDKRIYIDGSDADHSNWMRYINHNNVPGIQNTHAFQYQGQIFYKVIRPIVKNEEVLVCYGEVFAKELENDKKAQPDEKQKKVAMSANRNRPKRTLQKNPFIM